MTVPSTSRRAGPFLGNGATTTFSFTFKTFAAGDLRVIRTSTIGTETVLVLASDYNVTLNPDQDASPGGTITYPISGGALASGEKLTVLGDLDYEQTTDLLGGGAFNARVIEDTFDRTVIQVQQLKEITDRCVTIPASTSASAALPIPEPLQILGWNAAGDALTNFNVDDFLTVAGSSGFSVQTFSGTGAQTAFTLSQNPGAIANLEVFLSGVRRAPTTDYTVSGTTLTFTSAPPAGTDNILVRWGQTLGIGVPADGAVTLSKLGFNQGSAGFEQLAGFRNRLINGKMQVQQRGAATLSAGANVYTADRWFYRATGAAPSAITYAGAGGRVENGLTITGNTGLTKLVVAQRIEASNCLAIYNAQSLTVSAAMRNLPAANRVVTVNLYQANALNNFSSKTLLASATITITGAVFTHSVTLAPSSVFFNYGYELEFDFGAVDASTTVLLTRVQLETGTVATQYEDRTFGTELALCQRYFCKSYSASTAPGATIVDNAVFIARAQSSTTDYFSSEFPVTMRATPSSITLYSPDTGASGKIRDISAVSDVNATTQDSGDKRFTIAWTASAGAPYRFHYAASAEL